MNAPVCPNCNAPLHFISADSGKSGPCYRCGAPLIVVLCTNCSIVSAFHRSLAGSRVGCRQCNQPVNVVEGAGVPLTVAHLQSGAQMTATLQTAATAMSEGRFEESIALFQAVMAKEPQHRGVAHSQIGAALFFLKRYSEAIVQYELALQFGANPVMMEDNIAEAREALREI